MRSHGFFFTIYTRPTALYRCSRIVPYASILEASHTQPLSCHTPSHCAVSPTDPRPTKVPVWAVLDYTDTHCIERELLLAKVSILGPEYVEEQLQGGPTHDPRRIHPSAAPSPAPVPAPSPSEADAKLEREMALAQSFERGGHADAPPPLTPAQALQLRSNNLGAISGLAAQFGGRIVDVSENSVIVELSGKTKRVEAFLALVKPFGVLEAARTGMFAWILWERMWLTAGCRSDGHAPHADRTGARRQRRCR